MALPFCFFIVETLAGYLCLLTLWQFDFEIGFSAALFTPFLGRFGVTFSIDSLPLTLSRWNGYLDSTIIFTKAEIKMCPHFSLPGLCFDQSASRCISHLNKLHK